MAHRASRVLSTLSVTGLLLAGCGHTEHQAEHQAQTTAPATTTPAFPNWPALADGMRFHWTGEPGIDLYTGPAIPLRAYLESFWLVELFSDLDVGYPASSGPSPTGPTPKRAFCATIPRR